MKAHRWTVSCLILAGIALGAVLSGRLSLPQADAQGAGRAGEVVVVVGTEVSRELPIILVDSSEQTLLVYQYDYSGEDLELMSARTFRFDRLLTQFNNDGVTVDDVRREIRRDD
jgi:hypothetical protein